MTLGVVEQVGQRRGEQIGVSMQRLRGLQSDVQALDVDLAQHAPRDLKAVKGADKVKARDDAVIVARIAAKRVGFVAVDTTYPVVVTFEVNRDNKDLDGMLSASKPLIDGVATGIGVNDKRFRPMTLVVRKTSAAQQVIVEIADAKLGTFYPDRAPYDPNCPLGEIYA